MGSRQRAPSKCLDAAADLHDFGRFVMPDDQVFDPMISEAEGCHLWVCNLEAGDGLPSRQDSLTSDTLMDPMFVEVELLSALSSPTAAEDDAPSPILGSRSEMLGPLRRGIPPDLRRSIWNRYISMFRPLSRSSVPLPPCATSQSPEGHGRPFRCIFSLMPARRHMISGL